MYYRLKGTTTHVVACFITEKYPNGDEVVELVPRNWVKNDEDEWFSYYPPKQDYNKVNRWVKSSKEKSNTWEAFLIKILSECSKYFVMKIFYSQYASLL